MTRLGKMTTIRRRGLRFAHPVDERKCAVTVACLILWSLVVALVSAGAGCSDAAHTVRGFQSKSGDLSAFILSSAPKFGVRVLTTNGLAQIPAKWRYKEAANEFQLFIEGNYFPQLHAFLNGALGPSPGPPTTNNAVQPRSIEAYYGTNSGATVSCRWEKADDGEEYTSFVILSYGVPAADEAKFAHLFREAVEKGKDSFAALDPARPSAPYVSEFLRLFPMAEVRYRSFSGGLGFDITVDLYERYELNMQLPVVFDSSRRRVTAYGEPKFYLFEAASVKRNKSGIAEETLNPTGERHFGSAEWRKIVEAGGDFGTIGYTMLTNQPVPGFKNRKIAQEP